jgi:hypothetical protein
VDLSAFQDKPITGPVLREATEAIMDAITELLEQLRDEKAPPVRYDVQRAATEQRREREAGR